MSNGSPQLVEIEAFRVGPASRGITEADVEQAVTSYNARADASPAPLVLGHPQSDDPAHGLIAKARHEAGKLFLGLKNISEDAVKGVREKRFINRSIKFWHPTDPANPTPGKWDIRHLGLLGAAAPGIPGMSSLSFSADGDKIEADAEPAAALVIEFQAGTEIVTIIEGAPKVADPNPNTVDKAEFDAAVAERDRLQGIVDAAAVAADTARKAGNVAFVEKLVGEGRLLPGHKAVFTELFNRLPVDEVQFDATTKGTLGDELKKVLQAASPQIIFEALSPNGEKLSGPLDANQMQAKAHQLVKDGKAVSFEAAVEAIEKQGA